MSKALITLVFLIISMISTAWATPREIIIIRHGDKLEQAYPGPALSAKGQVRAVKFAGYYLKTFGQPDYVIAANPNNFLGKNSSIRELQTVAPLVNILSAKKPTTGFPILHPYENADYKKLAKFIMGDAMFNDKVILICWNHTKIPPLAEKLGVTTALNKWPANDFDSVYVLKYDDQGKVTHFTMMNNQYPVHFKGDWQSLTK